MLISQRGDVRCSPVGFAHRGPTSRSCQRLYCWWSLCFFRVVTVHGGVEAVSNRNSLKDVCFWEAKQNASRQHCFRQVTTTHRWQVQGLEQSFFIQVEGLINFNQVRHFILEKKKFLRLDRAATHLRHFQIRCLKWSGCHTFPGLCGGCLVG